VRPCDLQLAQFPPQIARAPHQLLVLVLLHLELTLPLDADELHVDDGGGGRAHGHDARPSEGVEPLLPQPHASQEGLARWRRLALGFWFYGGGA